MKLSIYSLKRILFQDEASSLNCKTVMGEVTVLDHHRPLISTLTEGTLAIVGSGGKEEYYPVKGGFLNVGTDNDVSVIVNE